MDTRIVGDAVHVVRLHESGAPAVIIPDGGTLPYAVTLAVTAATKVVRHEGRGQRLATSFPGVVVDSRSRTIWLLLPVEPPPITLRSHQRAEWTLRRALLLCTVPTRHLWNIRTGGWSPIAMHCGGESLSLETARYLDALIGGE